MSAPLCCPEAMIALRYLIHPRSGFEGTFSECPDCEGAGEIYWPGSRDPASAAERCFRCDGTGMITGETA